MKPSIVVVVLRRVAWIRSWLFDGVVAAFVAALTTVEQSMPWPIKTCALLMALFLIWRRHLPVTVLTVVYSLALTHVLMSGYVRLFDVAVLIAMYSVILYRPQVRWSVIAGAGAAAGVLLAATVEEQRSGNFWVVFWVVGAVTATTWVTAYGVRTRRLYVASLEERAATLERERGHLALLAVAEERAAIAREIHDVVAHSLSVMVVQADAAGFTLEGSQEPARRALDTIASTGREALEDMGRVVQLLRANLPRTPAAGTSQDRDLRAAPGKVPVGAGVAVRPASPIASVDGLDARLQSADGEGAERRTIGLKEVDSLVARSGLRVTRETVGEPGRLTAAQEITAYRIIQESLTNTMRHAGAGAAVTLRLIFAARSVRIEVSDDGGGQRRARPVITARPGHGLAGMRERVAVHGGDLEVGPGAGGGWQVVATIPTITSK